MYKLSRRKNLIWFLVTVGIGLILTVFLPSHFADSQFEIPAFALFPAEIALAMMLSVLFFENATPTELLRLSFFMMAMTMVSGIFCNVIARTSQTLPDSLLLNWVQLLCMNVTGLAATITLYRTRLPEETTTTIPLREPAPKAEPIKETHARQEVAGEKIDVASGESVKDILDKLDVSRINRLEKQITRQQGTGESVNFEKLFEDESSAAQKGEPVALPPPDAYEQEARAGSLDDLLSGDEIPAFKANKAKPAPRFEFEPTLPKPPAPEEKKEEPAVAKKGATAPEAPPTKPARAQQFAPIVLDDVATGIDDLFGDITLGAETATPAATPTPPPTPAPAPTPPVGPAKAEPAVKTTDISSLFDDAKLGGELEDIFANLAGGSSDDAVTAEKLAEIKASSEPAPAAAATPPPAKPADKLFGDSLGSDIDSIFDDLAPGAQKDVADLLDLKMDQPAASTPAAAETPAPSPAPTPAPAPASTSAAGGASGSGKEVKEFGRLSAAATARIEPSAPGTLKTIGQMLLDTAAVESIIKRAESRGEDTTKLGPGAAAKVVTVSRGADIQAMLDKVASFPDISGSLVIGKDGLLIGATESLGMMRDVLGVLGLGIHSTTNLGTKKIDMGDLRQSVFRTGEKLTILTEVGIGILACFCDKFNLESIDKMLDHIRNVISESQASGGTALPVETLDAATLAQHKSDAPSAPPPQAAPAAVATPAPVPPPALVPAAEQKGGLLNVSDDDIGGLFDDILSDSTAHNDALPAKPAAPAPVEAPKSAASAAGGDQKSGLINVNDDMMSDIFDGLLDKAGTKDSSLDFSPPAGTKTGETKPAQPAAPAAAAAKTEAPKAEPAKPEAPKAEPAKTETPAAKADAAAQAKPAETKEAPKAGQQIKEFGRLSSSSMAKGGGDDGAIKAIGRQLIDVQAVENIIKAGEKREKMGHGLTTARVISAARGEGIKALLTKIDGCGGVAGSLIVGNDGLVIASTLQSGLDKDLLGALCTAMHSHSELALKKLNMGKLKQVIFHTSDRTTILTAVAVGVLAVFVETSDLAQVDQLLVAIEQTVRG